MFEKLIALLLSVVLTFPLTGCSRSAAKIGVPEGGKGQKELTILCYAYDYDNLVDNVYYSNYIKKFRKQYDIAVKVEPIGVGNGSDEDIEDFEKKVATKLYAKNGPELIFVLNKANLTESMVRQGVAADLKEKISNIDKIYTSLLDKEIYYIPIGIFPVSIRYNKKLLDELGIEEIGLDMTKEGYYEIHDKWLAKAPRYLTLRDFNYTLGRYLGLDKIYDSANNKITANTPAVKQGIKDIHNEIYNHYKLDKSYTYENYYNMLYVPDSEEYKKLEKVYFSKECKEQNLWGQIPGKIDNMLYARNINEGLFLDVIMVPDYKNNKLNLSTCGFLINKNGKNLELAYEFVNGLLSNETQLDMFKPGKISQFYPINKDIEEEIKKLDSQEKYKEKAVDTRDYLLGLIKNGKCELSLRTSGIRQTNMDKVSKIHRKFTKDITKFIFADKSYSDEELSEELKRLEDEYNIWLNE